MNHRERLFCLVLAVALAASASAASFDTLTGEPIPAPSRDVPAVMPPPLPADGLRDGLTLIAHLAEGTSKEVRALGGNFIVWQNGAWLEFFDVSTPASPVRVARWLLAAQPSDMTVVGTTLYVALRKTEGLLALDVSDPTAPTLLDQLTGYDMLSVCVEGTYAYCGLGSTGVVIVDVSDAHAMSALTTFDTPGSANGTAIAGNTLYVAQGTSGLGIYDVTFPAAPAALGSYATGSFNTFVAVQNDVAYLAGNFGLITVNVAIPTVPTLLATLGVGDTTYEMDLHGDELYLAGLSGAVRVDISDPAAPAILAQSAVAGGLSVAVVGDAAFLADRFIGLRAYAALTLAPIGVTRNAGFSNRVHLVGPYLYVVDLGGGLRIWDITDPANATMLSATDLPANSQDVFVDGAVAYVVNANNSGEGLKVLDVSDPAAPTLLASYNTQNQGYGLDVQNDRVYIANGFGGLDVVDVSNPTAPADLGGFAFGANAFDTKVDGSVAYMALFGGGMASVDVSDPGSISLLDQQIGWGFLNALDIAAGYAWVADGQYGLRVVDISDPSNLVTLGTAGISGQARDVVWNGYVYAGDDFYGLRQFDVTDPTAPVLAGSFPSADRGMGVDAADEIVVLAAGEAGVYLFQGPPPVAAATGMLTALVNQQAVSLTISGNTAAAGDLVVTRTTDDATAARTWTAAEFDGLQVAGSSVSAHLVDHDAVGFPRTYTLALHTAGGDIALAETRVTGGLPTALQLTAAPNPFNPQLTVAFALPAPSPVTVAIYDAAGRLVRTFDLGQRPAGPGQVVWNGRDTSGQACASGVYALRLTAGDRVTSQTVTLVK